MTMRKASKLATLTALGLWIAACGARTPLDPNERLAAPGPSAGAGGAGGSAGDAGMAGTSGIAMIPDPDPECVIADDCPTDGDQCKPVACQENKCVELDPIKCDDADPCTEDSCDSQNGQCNFEPLSFDLDGDGFKGPAPGKKAGEPGSCGDDCDDSSAAAFPGGTEICDGVDNDCNGIVDDNAGYIPVNDAPVQVSEDKFTTAGGRGLAYNPISDTYFSSFSGEVNADKNAHLRLLDGVGKPTGASAQANTAAADAFAGPLIWTGDRYGMAWTDRRHQNYEIYFNTFGPMGNKLGPDVRISNAPDFSVGVDMGWNGNSFFIFWQDRRDGTFRIYTRRVSLDGKPLSSEVVVSEGSSAESVAAAVSSDAIGIVYRSGDSNVSQVHFRAISPSAQPIGKDIILAQNAVFETPSIAYNDGKFVVSYTQKAPHRLIGAVLSTTGDVLVSPKTLSPATDQTRFGQFVPLGDRLLALYSKQNANTNFDIYSQMFDPNLSPMGGPFLVANGPGPESVGGIAFGPSGDLGLFFTGSTSNGSGGFKNAAFFHRLRCMSAGP